MTTTTITLGAACLLALAGNACAAAPKGSPGALADQLFRQWTSPGTPGCALSVARGGKPVLVRAYGQADLEHGVPNTPHTIFEAGSISKQFTAAAILLLAQDGKLSLADDVRTYLPELPDYGQPMTLDHLLTHTGGLRDWGSIVELGGWPRGTRTFSMEQVLALAARQRALNFAPGTRYSYTNTGYVLAALVVQRVTGKTLAQFTRERLFVPLGMKRTQWRDNFRRIVPGRAVAYARTGEGYEQDMPFEDVYGHGGLLSTVGDLQIWNNALANNRLGAGITRQLEQLPVLEQGLASDYGRGLYVLKYGGAVELSHDGATGGYRTWLGRFPEQRLSIALLCNAGDAAPSGLARAVAQELLAPAKVPAPPARTVPAARPTLAGTFYNELNGSTLSLVHRDGTLALKNGPALRALDADTFEMTSGTFVFADDDHFVARAPGFEPMRYRRVQDGEAQRAALADYAGRYRNDEAMAAYTVIPGDDSLEFRMIDKPDYKYRLAPLGPDTFGGGEIVLRFQRDPSGAIVGAQASTHRLFDLRFRKMSH